MTGERLKRALLKVHALVEQLEAEPDHVRQVSQLALAFFDQTLSLHGLSTADRALLEAAALLHDTGYRFGPSGHHKRSRDIILKLDLSPFTPEEQRMVACIARYHRKAHPKSSHAVYGQLPPEKQQVVAGLAAILRIADGLDRSHSASVKALRVIQGEKEVRVEAQGASLLDLAGGQRKQQLFEEIFERELHLLRS